MYHKKPSEAQLKKARVKTIEKELKSMLEDEFLRRRHFQDSYSPYMAEKVLQVGEQGGGRAMMMKTIEVRTVATFNRWLEENEDFRDAYELAQVYCQAFLEDLLLKKATGENEAIDPKALKMMMEARFPEYKRESTNNKMEINITNNQLERLSDEELNDRLQQGYSRIGYKAPIDVVPTKIEEIIEIVDNS